MEKMLTVAEAAKALQVSLRTVYNLLESGALRSVRIGRAWRVPESALAEFVERGGGAPGHVFVLEKLLPDPFVNIPRAYGLTVHKTLEGAQELAAREAQAGTTIEWAQDETAPGLPRWTGMVDGKPSFRISEELLRD